MLFERSNVFILNERNLPSQGILNKKYQKNFPKCLRHIYEMPTFALPI